MSKVAATVSISDDDFLKFCKTARWKVVQRFGNKFMELSKDEDGEFVWAEPGFFDALTYDTCEEANAIYNALPKSMKNVC
jgi:hypothetical protein